MNRRTLLTLLACALLTLGIIAFYAGDRTLATLSLLLEETLYLGLYTAAATLLGSFLLRSTGIQFPARSLRLASAYALGMGTLGLCQLALGLTGLLSSLTAWALLSLAAATGLPHALSHLRQSRLPTLQHPLAIPIPLPPIWLAIALFTGAALFAAGILPGILWRPDDPHPYDVLIYHLQVPREWFELGRIAPLQHNIYSYFPFNVEIHYLTLMHLRGSPWATMYTAQYLSLIFTAATALALWGLLRPISTTAATLAVAAFCLTPWTLLLSCIAYVESGLVLYATLTLAHTLQLSRATPQPARHTLFAGLFAGFAAGVKLTALPMLALPVALFILLACPRPSRLSLRNLLLFLAFALLTVSPWLARNYAWSGNPVFPLAMNTLGPGHFTPEQVARFDQAHQPRPDQQSLPARLQAAGHQILLDWRYGLIILPLAAIGAILTHRRRETWLCCLLIAITLAVWLSATHLQSRFFVIALPAAAILIALLPPKLAPYLAATLSLLTLFTFTGHLLPHPSTSQAGLHPYLQQAATLADGALIALPSPQPLMPEDLQRATDLGKTLLFVGDAQIFWKTAPMSQIRYRTVFDISAPAPANAIEAWHGAPLPHPATDLLPIISLSEVHRLSGTYSGIPSLSPEQLAQYPHALVRP